MNTSQLSQMLDSTDAKNFYPAKGQTRFDYLKKCFFIIGFIAIAHALYTIRFSHRNTSTDLQWSIDFILGGILLIWTLTNKTATRICLDLKGKKILVHYMTIFSDEKIIEVPFECLTFDYRKEPTRLKSPNWTLKIFNKKKKAFIIDTKKDEFSQEILDSLVEELKLVS